MVEDDWELTKIDNGAALEDQMDGHFFIRYYLRSYDPDEEVPEYVGMSEAEKADL